MFIGILLIFAYAVKDGSGTPWLYSFWNYVVTNWSSKAVASIGLLIVVVSFMYFTVRSPGTSKKKEEKRDE